MSRRGSPVIGMLSATTGSAASGSARSIGALALEAAGTDLASQHEGRSIAGPGWSCLVAGQQHVSRASSMSGHHRKRRPWNRMAHSSAAVIRRASAALVSRRSTRRWYSNRGRPQAVGQYLLTIGGAHAGTGAAVERAVVICPNQTATIVGILPRRRGSRFGPSARRTCTSGATSRVGHARTGK